MLDLDAEPASADEEPPVAAGTSTELEWSALFESEDVEEAAGAGAETDAVFVADEPARLVPD